MNEVNPEEEDLNQRLFDENGYNGLISDKISVNRSIVDLRHNKCKKLRYLKELPSVSIVIPFYNEHLSVLLRTIHSVLNRSPDALLREIILINDRSTKEFLYEPLKTYIKENFRSDKVKLLELPSRSGLIWARLAGARAATGEVLIFLDSHTEPNVNWLPPLLEPIAENYRVCICPFIDVIEFKTFEYVSQDEGSRGIFDWNFNYRKLDLKEIHQRSQTDLFESPVMAGGLFAISAKFFWELGGYDTGVSSKETSPNKLNNFLDFSLISGVVNSMNLASKYGYVVAKCTTHPVQELVISTEVECRLKTIEKALTFSPCKEKYSQNIF